MIARIKKEDLVAVVSGKDKDKQGHVILIDNKKERVLVKGIGVVVRHMKARKQGETSRITKEESSLPLCKVMPVCTSCKKRCRIRVRLLDDGKTVRSCHHCKEAF